MLVGLLSDSHGRVEATRLAVKILRDRGAELLVHCGDVGGDKVLAELVGGPAVFVFGNNDFGHDGLRAFASGAGIRCGNERVTVDLGGKLGVVTHGDNSSIIADVLRRQAVDYLFLGHTHERADSTRGRVRVINPGAIYRAKPKSIALLDTEADSLESIVLDLP